MKQMMFLKSISSTNDALKQMHRHLKHKTILYTDEQTKGRGRRENTWYGDYNSIMMSILLKENIQKNLIFVTSLAIYDILVKETINVDIKWPNDILVNGKKICGILIESGYQGNSKLYDIIGVGLNLNQEELPNELEQIAISLKSVTGKLYDKLQFQNEIIERIFFYLETVTNEEMLTLYKQRVVQLKGTIEYRGDNYLVSDVDQQARLILTKENNTVILDNLNETLG